MTAPSIVATASQSGRSTPVSSTSLLAFGTTAGMYQVTGYVSITSGSANSLAVGLHWGDGLSGHSQTAWTYGPELGAVTNAYIEVDQVINSDGTGVNYEIASVGGGTCPTYDASLVVIQLF